MLTIKPRPKSPREVSSLTKSDRRRLAGDLRAATFSPSEFSAARHRNALQHPTQPRPQWHQTLSTTVLVSLETTVLKDWRVLKPERVSARCAFLKTLKETTRSPRDVQRVQAMEACSQQFAVVQTEAGPRLQCHRCRERMCPECQRVRAYRYELHYEKELLTWKHGKFLTLTIKTKAEPVGKTITKLYGYFKRLRQHAVWKQLVRGGYTCVEITRNYETKLFHVHLHVLMDADYIPKDWLHETWETITGDSWNIGIEAAGKERAHYMAKYVGKTFTGTLSGEEHWEMADQLKGRRLAQPFGDVPPLNTDNDASLYDGPVLGTLAEILDRAAGGDTEAQVIIAGLHAHYGRLPGERNAPPEPVPIGQLELGTEALE